MTEMTTSRGIEIITAEIVEIRGYAQRIALKAAVEIGRRLVEAKELLPYGEWGNWLKERVSFSQSSAQRLMRLYEEYGDKQGSLFGADIESSTLTNLSVSNALKLLAVPADEREEFAAEHDVENLSARQMDELMAQLKKTTEEKNEAELALEGKKNELSGVTKERNALALRVEELESRPVEVAVQEPDPAKVQAAVDEAVKQATADYKDKEKSLKQKLKDAEDRLKKLEAEAAAQKKTVEEAEGKLRESQTSEAERIRLEREVEALKKQLAMSDGAVASFQTLFEQGKDVFSRMISAIEAVADGETRARLCSATKKLGEMLAEQAASIGRERDA